MASSSRSQGRGTKSRPTGWRRGRRWLLVALAVIALLAAAFGLLGFYLVFSSVPLPDDIDACNDLGVDFDPLNGEPW